MKKQENTFQTLQKMHTSHEEISKKLKIDHRDNIIIQMLQKNL